MERESRLGRIVGIALAAAALASTHASHLRAAETPPGTSASTIRALDRVRTLMNARHYGEALDAANAHLLNDLPYWSLSFNEQAVGDAWIGQSRAYFRSQSRGRGEVGPAVPKRWIPPEAKNNDWLHYVTCVDLTTGRPVWKRMFDPHPRLAIDPRNDNLWAWHEHAGWFEEFDARTGESVRRGDLATKGRLNHLECLRDGDADLWSGTDPNSGPGLSATRLDLATKELQREIPRPFLLSPGGLRRLSYGTSEFRTTVSNHSPAGGQALWTFEMVDTTYNAPTWISRDALVFAGGPYAPGILYRLDGEFGIVKWRRPIQAYGFAPTMTQLGGGSYAAGGWLPFGTVGGEAWAIDLSNRMSFFDAESGRPTRVRALGAAPVAAPKFLDEKSGGGMIVATVDGIRRLPPTGADGTSTLAELLAMKVRAQIALGRTMEAVGTATKAVQQAHSPVTLDALADALAATNDQARSTAARARALLAGSAEAAEALRRSRGLAWWIPTGPTSAAPLVLPDGTVLVAELDGTLRTIDPASGKQVAEEHVEGGVSMLTLRGDQLISRGGDGKEDVVRQFVQPPAIPTGDPLFRGHREEPLDSNDVDRNWYTRGGADRIGAAQRVKDRLVRPMRGGGVRELVDGRVVEISGNLASIEEYAFAVVGDDVVAYGTSGVYAVNPETLVPERPIIDLGEPVDGSTPFVQFVTGDRDTLAFVFRRQKDRKLGFELQIHSRDGRRMLRAAPVLSVNDMEHQRTRLVRVGAGYFVSAGELLYLPIDPAKPEWRFGLFWDDPPRRDWSDVQGGSFGVPRVVGGRVVVAGYRGAILGFDVKAFGE